MTSTSPSSTFRLKVISWRDPKCTRTLDFAGTHTLFDVHHAIQQHFELGNDHRWAFFLSGEYFDRSTSFGLGANVRSAHDARLGQLELSAGMTIAYAFDELRHDLRVIEIRPEPMTSKGPVLVASEGKAPKQYAQLDEADDEEPLARSRWTEPELSALSSQLKEAEALLIELEDSPLEQASPEKLERLATLTRALLAACPGPDELLELSDATDFDVRLILGDIRRELLEGGKEAAASELTRELARRRPRDRHAHGFPEPELDELAVALLSLRDVGQDYEDLLQDLSLPQRDATFDRLVRLAPTTARLTELACELNSPAVLELACELVEERVTRVPAEQLVTTTEAGAAMLGALAYRLAARSLARAGRSDDARRCLEVFARAEPNPSDRDSLDLARTWRQCGSPGEAERVLRTLVQKRWVSGHVRREATEELASLLREAGRAQEAGEVERLQRSHVITEGQATSRTIRNEAPKVGRNDPCACGSGKKAKKCCAA